MKYFIILSFSICMSVNLFAQKDNPPLPECRDLAAKLSVIKLKFDTFLEAFKNAETKKNKNATEYSSNFELCGAQSKLKDWGFEKEYTFNFNELSFKGNREEYVAFFEKLFNAVSGEFGNTHRTVTTADLDKYRYYSFYENDKSVVASKRNVIIQLSLQQPLAVNLTFEYKANR